MIGEALKNNSVLTKLDLIGKQGKGWTKKKRRRANENESTGNGIGDEGTKTISELLESNSVLSELNLGGEKEI